MPNIYILGQLSNNWLKSLLKKEWKIIQVLKMHLLAFTI